MLELKRRLELYLERVLRYIEDGENIEAKSLAYTEDTFDGNIQDLIDAWKKWITKTKLIINGLNKELEDRYINNRNEILERDSLTRKYLQSGSGPEVFIGAAKEIVNHLKAINEDLNDYILSMNLDETNDIETSINTEINPKNEIALIYGRDSRAVSYFQDLLRKFGLIPISWEQLKERASKRSGEANPYIGEIIKEIIYFEGILAILTPDDHVLIRDALRKSSDLVKNVFQPRPNVILELGAALALKPDKTLIVQISSQDLTYRPISDLEGRHILEFKDNPKCKQDLFNQLSNLGLVLNKSDTSYLLENNKVTLITDIEDEDFSLKFNPDKNNIDLFQLSLEMNCNVFFNFPNEPIGDISKTATLKERIKQMFPNTFKVLDDGRISIEVSMIYFLKDLIIDAGIKASWVDQNSVFQRIKEKISGITFENVLEDLNFDSELNHEKIINVWVKHEALEDLKFNLKVYDLIEIRDREIELGTGRKIMSVEWKLSKKGILFRSSVLRLSP